MSNSFFQIRTLGGELVRIMRQENNVKFLSKSSEANLRASNIETAFGLVQVIDSVLIWEGKKCLKSLLLKKNLIIHILRWEKEENKYQIKGIQFKLQAKKLWYFIYKMNMLKRKFMYFVNWHSLTYLKFLKFWVFEEKFLCPKSFLLVWKSFSIENIKLGQQFHYRHVLITLDLEVSKYSIF